MAYVIVTLLVVRLQNLIIEDDMKGRDGSINIKGGSVININSGDRTSRNAYLSVNGRIFEAAPGQTLDLETIIADSQGMYIGMPGRGAAAAGDDIEPQYHIENGVLTVKSYGVCNIGGNYQKVIVKNNATYQGDCVAKEVVVENNGTYIDNSRCDIHSVLVGQYGTMKKEGGSIGNLKIDYKSQYDGSASITQLDAGGSSECTTSGSVVYAHIGQYAKYTDNSAGRSEKIVTKYKAEVTKARGSIGELIPGTYSSINVKNIGPRAQDREALLWSKHLKQPKPSKKHQKLL